MSHRAIAAVAAETPAMRLPRAAVETATPVADAEALVAMAATPEPVAMLATRKRAEMPQPAAPRPSVGAVVAGVGRALARQLGLRAVLLASLRCLTSSSAICGRRRLPPSRSKCLPVKS